MHTLVVSKGRVKMGRPRTLERPPEKKQAMLVFDTLAGTLLPEGHTLCFNTALGTLLLLTVLDNAPYLVAEQQFTNAEVGVLCCLLSDYPHYSPYERVLAHFTYGGTATATQVAYMREKMETAQNAGGVAWDDLMRPMRNVASRTRLKVEDLGILVIAFHEIGYMLMPTTIL